MDIDNRQMTGRSDTGWILAVVALLVVLIIGYFAWASTMDTDDSVAPDPTPSEESTPATGGIDMDAGMDLTLPPPEEGEYEGIGEPPA